MGVHPMAAHLFVFYYGMYSFITPPVALGAYAASGLAGSPPLYTGFVAWKIALPGFILPFLFVFSPGILMVGDVLNIVRVSITAFFGVAFFAVGIAGYFKRRLNMLERVLMSIAGITLIHSGVGHRH